MTGPGKTRLLVTAALLVALAGCSSAPEPPAEESPTAEAPTPSATPTPSPSETDLPTGEPFQVTLDVAAEVTSSGTLLVTVATNLPDGSELGGWLSSADYQAQDRRYVDGGVVVLGPFSNDGGRLPSGSYDFSVSMSVARLQSPEVRQYIGEKGELMAGPYVVPDTIEGGFWVNFDTTVVIP